jgi:hypothetical protein
MLDTIEFDIHFFKRQPLGLDSIEYHKEQHQNIEACIDHADGIEGE